MMYKYFQDEGPRVAIRAVLIDDETSTLEATAQDMMNSFLHITGVMPRIIPYTNMVRWVIETTDIMDRKFHNWKFTMIGFFSSQGLLGNISRSRPSMRVMQKLCGGLL